MRYYSTSNRSSFFSFEDAVMRGLAPDGGLFMPEQISPLPPEFWRTLQVKSFRELSYDVTSHFLNEDFTKLELSEIIDHAISFDAPLVKITDSVYTLELFHGPTLAFKDFGARFLAGVMGSFAKNKTIHVVVATSGDTGSAVAHGFYKVPGTRVIILYPSGKVSDFQEQQMTGLGENIVALEVQGTFDDCQRMVKQAFLDETLRKAIQITSANSINIARLLPQLFYYFRAFQQLSTVERENFVISVPCGNLGNLTAGLIAKRMGLPVRKFIAATNVNDVLPSYLLSSMFIPRPSRKTISNAMDVGDPSNFSRILDLYGGDPIAINRDLTGFSFSDDETVDCMGRIYNTCGYTLDPHGAVACLGLEKFLKSQPATGIFLETAHPSKFNDIVEKAIEAKVNIPDNFQSNESTMKQSISVSKYDQVRQILLA